MELNSQSIELIGALNYIGRNIAQQNEQRRALVYAIDAIGTRLSIIAVVLGGILGVVTVTCIKIMAAIE